MLRPVPSLPLLLLLLAAPPLAGQTVPTTNRARQLAGHYTAPHGFDLLHQRVHVGGFDWDSLSFTGRTELTLVPRAGADSLVLAAHRRIEVARVELLPRRAGGAAAPLRFTRPRDTLVVRLARRAGARDTLRVRVAYRARMEQGRGMFFIPRREGHAGTPQVYTSGGTDGTPRWLPTTAAPDDKTTWEIAVDAPRGLAVVSNGARAARPPAPCGGPDAPLWRQTKPASTYLMSFVVAPLRRIRDSLSAPMRGRPRTVPVDYWVYPQDTARAAPAFDITPDVLAAFERLTGVAYPWSKYAQATVADYFGGMENVSASTMIDVLPDSAALLDRPWYRHVLVPHEAAHQWFGNLVTTENWANYWLNEGMAQYMAGAYWQARQGARAGEDFFLGEYRQYLARDARRRVPLAAWNSSVVYPKGALVLRMLEQRLGAERFWAGMRRYLTRHAYGNATSEDLRHAFESAAPEAGSLEDFFDQWVYHAGHPDLAVRAHWDSAGRRLVLAVRQTQADTLSADSTGLRYTVPPAFRFPVRVRVGTAAGEVVRDLAVARREDTLIVDGVRAAPTMVVFDDGARVLKRLDFPQPTPWLAAALAARTDLWTRSWAIAQLAARTDDPAAGAALARAARGADWFATRAEAATALARFPAGLAAPALEAALADTSAAVRAAALGALGAVGAPSAVERALAAWERERSYQVRAAAVGVIGRRASAAAARPVLLAALRTPSYLDVIRNAALAVMGAEGEAAAD
jgi:aminopeptidase N